MHLLFTFKGIYFELRPERVHLVHANIYYSGCRSAFPWSALDERDVYTAPTAIPAWRGRIAVLQGAQLDESLRVGI